MVKRAKPVHFFILILANVLAWASFFGVIFFVSPASAGAFGAAILVVSLLAGLACLGILLWQLKTFLKK